MRDRGPEKRITPSSALAPGASSLFRYTADEVTAQRSGLESLREVESLTELVADLAAGAAYLMAAEHVLPATHPWVSTLQTQKAQIMADVGSPQSRTSPSFRQPVAPCGGAPCGVASAALPISSAFVWKPTVLCAFVG